MGHMFQVWKFHLKISPWEEKPHLLRAYGPVEASFSSCGLIFGGEEISIPETQPIQKSYISVSSFLSYFVKTHAFVQCFFLHFLCFLHLFRFLDLFHNFWSNLQSAQKSKVGQLIIIFQKISLLLFFRSFYWGLFGWPVFYYWRTWSWYSNNLWD